MLEGKNLASWWDWKNTLGPLKDRPAFDSPWGYLQTNGFGMMEYLNFAEDMGMDLGKLKIRVTGPHFLQCLY